MSKQSALAFLNKVREDTRLRDQIRGIRRKELKAMVKVAAEAGYLFSLKDYRAALDTNGELPEYALNLIANGQFFIPGLDLSPHEEV